MLRVVLGNLLLLTILPHILPKRSDLEAFDAMLIRAPSLEAIQYELGLYSQISEWFLVLEGGEPYATVEVIHLCIQLVSHFLISGRPPVVANTWQASSQNSHR